VLFTAEYRIEALSPNIGTVRTNTQGIGQACSTHILWLIGILSKDTKATLNIVVSLGINPSGKNEFTSPGIYSLGKPIASWTDANGSIQTVSGPELFVETIECVNPCPSPPENNTNPLPPPINTLNYTKNVTIISQQASQIIPLIVYSHQTRSGQIVR